MLDTDTTSYLIKGRSPTIEAKLAAAATGHSLYFIDILPTLKDGDS
jgi:hypothetical protein